MSVAPKRVAVVICSLGRSDTLAQMMPYLMRQTVLPSRILLVVTKPEDAPDFAKLLPHAPVLPEVILSEKGSSRQRNVGLDHVVDHSDFVFFQDDDYVPSCHVIADIIKAFEAFPEVTGVTGNLLADGINSEGISIKEAGHAVVNWEQQAPDAGRGEPTILNSGLLGLYGCNMAVRSSAAKDVRFDEKLPLYAWQEDLDFGARLPGQKVRLQSLVGVHCGVKSGRERNGAILGYSQIANPLYLIRKGSIPWRRGLTMCLRNFTANHLRALRPEAWVDRRGRARGNWIAIADVLMGRSDPEKILKM
ncbi:glycosyltransferase family A protein [Shimia sp. R9_3]|uniref:glycosyltransferase family 2 protein n=1 Tax=Shimia sp. R9_3 TaxID=2821113 RepID=UPI001ADD2A73|nr:glycosyltransferase family A protein [Shimia sp. R9_3]MBO9402189.1 glycosyltransferase family 2 protein [Shimia sp. R9_3]